MKHFTILASVLIWAVYCDPDTTTTQTCEAGDSFRRTAHYACHGYIDGKKAEFVTCVKGSKYQFIDGIRNCASYLPGIDTNNEPAAAAHMCVMHANQTALPLFDCMANYFGTMAGCGLTGCKAATYAMDELTYDILKCYHQVYATFPLNFKCVPDCFSHRLSHPI